MMTFGKYTAMTYEEVWREDYQYCQWAMQTAETESSVSLQLQRFARYCQNMEEGWGER